MRNLRRIATSLVALALLLAFSSCEKQPAAEDSSEVTFKINNLTNSLSKKDGITGSTNDPTIPTCSDEAPVTVKVTIDGTTYTLKVLQNYGDGTETEVLKLDEGAHTITMFEVYDANGTIIWLSPAEGSYYDNLWSVTGVELPFRIDKFQKHKVDIDVLCFEPYNYENFGFSWFDFDQIKVKTLCFFGDVCTKFHVEWHAENSPYNGQSNYEGYDFPSIFEVVITDEDGNVVNDLTQNSNLSWQGVGEPLCIEYPDYVGQVDNYTFTINLMMPDGTYDEVYSQEFTAEEFNNTDGDPLTNFGQKDGVFDFVVGNCSYDGNDADMELPAWVPFPSQVDFKVYGPLNTNGYIDMTFRNVVGATVEIYNTVVVPSWCAAKDDVIYRDVWYTANVYSSLNPPSMPAQYSGYNWGALNWILNNHDAIAPAVVQKAIWYFTNGGAVNTLATEASSHSGYMPTVGDWAIIAFDAIDPNPDKPVQLMIVKVDP